MLIAVALMVGYLLGSVLPADLFARARGVDIRAIGTRNPGSTNALQQLGPVVGLLTAAYDMSVGLVAMFVASRLGLEIGWVYLAGLASIVGHVYPVFFGFRGGQGMAAATGMLLYGMAVALGRGWVTAPGLTLLAVVGAAVFVLTRSASVVGVFAVPVLALELLIARPQWRYAAFMAALMALIWATQLGLARGQHLFRLSPGMHERIARMRVKTH